MRLLGGFSLYRLSRNELKARKNLPTKSHQDPPNLIKIHHEGPKGKEKFQLTSFHLFLVREISVIMRNAGLE